MFRILAIQVQKECKDSMRRCLVPGMMYYLNNEYVISETANSKCTMSRRTPFAKNIDEQFYRIDPDKNIRINVSAIVGENGAGKSTLVELLLRTINNAAIKFELLADKDELVYVEGLYVSVYFESDGSIFRLTVAGGKDDISLKEVGKIKPDGVTQEDRELSTDEVKECFFYTLVSNYSHYAYNTYDFRSEWIKQTDEDSCWLKWLFHKNDGYQAPLTLHPFRDKGTIGIEREKELSNQRLLYFFMDYGKTAGQNSVFENIKNKRPKYLNLVEVKKSKLQEHTILRFFQEEKNTYLLKEQIGIAETIGITKLKDGKLLAKNDTELIKKIIVPLEHLAYRTMGLDKDRQNRHHLLFRTMKTWIEEKDKELKDKGKDGLLPVESDLKKLLEVLESLHGYLKAETYQRAKKLELLLDRYSCMNLCQLQRLELIDDVCDFWNGHVAGVDIEEDMVVFDLTPTSIVKDYGELTQKEKCYHYIVYKTIDIFETYTRLYDDPTRYFHTMPLGFQGTTGNITAVPMEKAYIRLVADVRMEKTHITLKLRQTLYYLEHSLKDDADGYVVKGKLVEGFDGFCLSLEDLAAYYAEEEERNADTLPPPIYERHFIFETTDGRLTDMDTFSSGEKQILNTQSAIIYHLQNLCSIFKDKSRMKFSKVNIILEEIELYFHPDYQRKFVDSLIYLLEHSGIEDAITDINIIIVTHSPFILSDIPKSNVLFIKDGRIDNTMQTNTFGANIHNLLKNGFFLPGLPMGEFAHRKIDGLFAKLNSGEFPLEILDDIYRDIMLVGEPVLRNELLMLFGGYKSLKQ
jgi:ABC-type dipeptide/oligopeptide/nickel transport system ATPase component